MSTATPMPTHKPTTRRWTLDPARSTAEFAVKHFWGLITVRGHFDRIHGSYNGTTVELTIDADSLGTGHQQRDTHLHSADFFHIESHPQVRFTSSKIEETGHGSLDVTGELEAAGHHVPLTFDATVRAIADKLEIEATTTVDQRLFAMNWSSLEMTQPPATLHVKAQLVSA
jgi:polyisoprenoid-binding protein YceI